MNTLTRQRVEDLSRLLQAVHKSGGVFLTGLKTNIEFRDGIKLPVEEKGFVWRIGGWSIPKSASSKALQIFIMEQHLKNLREFN